MQTRACRTKLGRVGPQIPGVLSQGVSSAACSLFKRVALGRVDILRKSHFGSF